MECPNCHNEAPFYLVHRRTWFSLFLVPLIPYRSEYLLLCSVCSKGAILTKPQVDEVSKKAALAAPATTLLNGVPISVSPGPSSLGPTVNLATGAVVPAQPVAGPVPNLSRQNLPWRTWGIAAAVLAVIGIYLLLQKPTFANPSLLNDHYTYVGTVYTETGTIRNDGSERATNVYVEVVVKDTAGSTLGRTKQTLSDLDPGKSADFTVVVPLPSNAPDQINAAIYWYWHSASGSCPPGTSPTSDPNSPTSTQICAGK